MALGEDFGALENDDGENHFFIKAIHGSFAFINIVQSLIFQIVTVVAKPSSLARTTFADHTGTQKGERNPWEMLRGALLSLRADELTGGSSRGAQFPRP